MTKPYPTIAEVEKATGTPELYWDRLDPLHLIKTVCDLDRERRDPLFTVPGLHPLSDDLMNRFALALKEKLAVAQVRYGFGAEWADAAWMDECRAQLVAHVAKGDPRDVANYCAFLWHHGERTA